MANPSSSHHDRDERHRSSSHRDKDRSSSHHHHRTVSSTTLLLVLSLILAVLAVMLSLPSASVPGGAAGAPAAGENAAAGGVLGYLTPKRTQALLAREKDVAIREAEVARREAELLAGAPGGVVQAPIASPVACPACEPQMIIKEVVKEQELTPPGWWKEAGARADDIIDRELKIAERERDISKREENVNRREHDASRRESWIMEQLIALGNEAPQTYEEEYVYDPIGAKRKAKEPILIEDTIYEPEPVPVQTVIVNQVPPANTRLAAFPTPEPVRTQIATGAPRTTAIEIVEEEVEAPLPTAARLRPLTRRPPARWFGGW